MDQTAWRGEACGHKTMYGIIVQVPAFGPSNKDAPSGSPWGGVASPAGTGRPRCPLQAEDTQHCLIRVDASGMGVGTGSSAAILQQGAGFSEHRMVTSAPPHPHPPAGQVENSATGVILRQGKGNLTRFMGGRKLWVSPKCHPP